MDHYNDWHKPQTFQKWFEKLLFLLSTLLSSNFKAYIDFWQKVNISKFILIFKTLLIFGFMNELRKERFLFPIHSSLRSDF